jgi:hypothetical protein
MEHLRRNDRPLLSFVYQLYLTKSQRDFANHVSGQYPMEDEGNLFFSVDSLYLVCFSSIDLDSISIESSFSSSMVEQEVFHFELF